MPQICDWNIETPVSVNTILLPNGQVSPKASVDNTAALNNAKLAPIWISLSYRSVTAGSAAAVGGTGSGFEPRSLELMPCACATQTRTTHIVTDELHDR